MTPRQGRWIALLFVVFVIVMTIVFASGCSKKESPINSGTVQDKSRYPETEVKYFDCDRNKKNCELDRVEKNPERCTLTIKEDDTVRVGEVEIPCNTFDNYKKGDWWLRPDVKSPEPSGGQQ